MQKYIKKVQDIGSSLQQNIHNIDNPTYRISMLNEHLFDNYGFIGDEEDYYDPKNNFLNEVLDKKSGLPIIISILYTEIAKYIGLDMKIIGFPSHIFVQYKQDLFIDPFYGGRIVDLDDMQQILDVNFGGEDIQLSPELLIQLSDKQILIRIARNLRHSYMQSYAFEKALLCTDLVLAIENDVPDDIRDKGILEEKLGHAESALKYLKQYLEVNPNADDADYVLDLIQRIRTGDNNNNNNMSTATSQ